MTFDVARTVADAVLLEGYLLYPYRASAQKNQLRWQFGVLMPPAYPEEAAYAQTECLLEPNGTPRLAIQLRFLQVRPTSGADEGITREVDFHVALAPHEQVLPFAFDDAISGAVRVTTERLDGPYGVVKVRVRAENTSPWRAEPATREAALRHALVSAHTLLAATDGAFISMVDPPEWARPAVEACVNERTWPVLVGEPGRRDVMLSAPIILYDYPRIAAESHGELFDGTEIDEILTLRTMALTDAEKREARLTDPRAAALVDRVDGMPPEILERLHGAVRSLSTMPERPLPWWDPGADASVSPETDNVRVGSTMVARGGRVRLTPGVRRADAHDMFLAGRIANVEAVFRDVDGERYLAVTLADDPGADLQIAHGRFLYFRPDEVEPL